MGSDLQRVHLHNLEWTVQEKGTNCANEQVQWAVGRGHALSVVRAIGLLEGAMQSVWYISHLCRLQASCSKLSYIGNCPVWIFWTC